MFSKTYVLTDIMSDPSITGDEKVRLWTVFDNINPRDSVWSLGDVV